MEFSKKYKLIDQLPGEGVQSYRALQMDAGRDVAVHLLMGGKTPENEALLVRLRAMQPQSLARLIEVGEDQGSTFVVTVAPPFQRLEEWLAEQEREAAATKEFGKAGFWKRPDIGAMTAPQPQPAKVPQPPPAAAPAREPGQFTKQFQLSATPAAEPGDFTRMFQSPAAPTATTAPPTARPAETPPAEPGDFTRMFQSPATPSPATTAPLSAPPPPPRPVETPAAEPGDFTRMFQSPAAPAAVHQPPVKATSQPGEFTQLFQAPPQSPAQPPRPSPPAAGPGEFTHLFNSPMPDVPAQGDWPPAPPKAQEPGDFTRMFQAPAAARPEAAAPTGGEFTQLFKPSPGGSPAGPQFPSASQFPPMAPAPAPPPPQQELGEYTRMFGPGTLPGAPPPAAGAPPAAPPPSYVPGGGATQAFRSVPGTVPPAQPQGPSEYTRMISVPSIPGAPPPAAAPTPPMPTPGMPQMGVPQMPYMQQPAAPQMPYMPPPAMPQVTPPQVVAPQVKAPGGNPANLVLIAIFCLLAFLAGGIVVYLLARRG